MLSAMNLRVNLYAIFFRGSLFLYFFLGVFSTSALVFSSPLLRSAFQVGMLLSFLMLVALWFIMVLDNKPSSLSVILFVFFFVLLFKPLSAYSHIIISFVISVLSVRHASVYNFGSVSIKDYAEVLLPAFYATSAAVLLAFLSVKLGVVEEREFYILTSGTLKSSAGFYNPNAAGIYALSLLIYVLIARWRWTFMLAVSLSIIVLFEVKARTSILGVFLVIFLLAVFKTIKLAKVLPLGMWVGLLIYAAVFVFFSFIIAFRPDDLFVGGAYELLNEISSFRGSLLLLAVDNISPFSFLFGSYSVPRIEMGVFMIMSLIGLIGVFVVLVGVSLAHYNGAYREEGVPVVVLFFTFLVVNFFESFLYSYNLFFILFMYVVLKPFHRFGRGLAQ
jgi:hypothetical protein